ncbi:MAG: hypothetical protein LQ348_003962, partial [Seirophora lacunosa]
MCTNLRTIGTGRRLKEQSIASFDEDSSDAHEHQVSPQPRGPYDHQIPRQHQYLHEHQKPSTLPAAGLPDDPDNNIPTSSLSQTTDAMMAEEMTVKPNESPWQPLDPMIPPQMPGCDASNPFAFSLAQGCTCNGMTGPCARHLEEIRFQAFNAAMPTQLPRFMPTHTRNTTCTSQYEGSPNLLGLDFTAPDMFRSIPQQQSQGILHHRPDGPSSSPKTTITSISNPDNNNSSSTNRGPRPCHRSNSSAGEPIPTRPSTRTNSKRSAPSPMRSSTSGVPITPPTSEDSSSSTSRSKSTLSDLEEAGPDRKRRCKSTSGEKPSDTTRFNTILEAVRAAGFPEFDSMVTAYYTTAFEKSSIPDMAQRASRGRRLAKVVKDVHESSNRWPRWEARGFRESTMESAKAICVDEIEKVAQHLESAHGDHTLDEAEQPPSALNLSHIGTTDAAAMPLGSNGGTSQESRLLVQLRTLPEDVEAAAQDE